jgi:hypothetical protein
MMHEAMHRVLGLAREHAERGNEAHALRVQGEVLARGSGDGQALDYCRAALKLAETLTNASARSPLPFWAREVLRALWEVA